MALSAAVKSGIQLLPENAIGRVGLFQNFAISW